MKFKVIVEVTLLCTMHLGKLSVVQVYESESRIESECDSGGNSLYYVFGQVEYICRAGGRFQYCDTTPILSTEGLAMTPTHNSAPIHIHLKTCMRTNVG